MEKSIDLQTISIGEIARQNFNTIQIFRKYGINFYNKGENLLSKACAFSECDEKIVSEELQTALSLDIDENHNFNSWSLEKLITYIVNYHHKYTNIHIPEISAFFKVILETKETSRADIIRMSNLFRQLGNDMRQHLQKEEIALFPFIKKLESGTVTNQNFSQRPSVKSLITVVEFEHDTSEIVIGQINRLCNNYTYPERADTLFCTLLDTLREFESDLIMHIHLENNILHPRAIELERALLN